MIVITLTQVFTRAQVFVDNTYYQPFMLRHLYLDKDLSPFVSDDLFGFRSVVQPDNV